MESRSLWSGWRRAGSVASEPKRAEPDPPPAPDTELQARRAEIARMEEQALRERESLAVQKTDVERRELERISGLSASQAKDLLLADVEREARRQAGLRLVELEEQTRREAERRARSILSVAMQRLASRHSSESTTRLVELPGD